MGGDISRGRQEDKAWLQVGIAEAKGRLLVRLPSPPLSCCSALAMGPEAPAKHRNKPVLPGAGNYSA